MPLTPPPVDPPVLPGQVPPIDYGTNDAAMEPVKSVLYGTSGPEILKP